MISEATRKPSLCSRTLSLKVRSDGRITYPLFFGTGKSLEMNEAQQARRFDWEMKYHRDFAILNLRLLFRLGSRPVDLRVRRRRIGEIIFRSFQRYHRQVRDTETALHERSATFSVEKSLLIGLSIENILEER